MEEEGIVPPVSVVTSIPPLLQPNSQLSTSPINTTAKHGFNTIQMQWCGMIFASLLFFFSSCLFLLSFGYSIDDFAAIEITINSFFRLTSLTLSPALYTYFYGVLIFDKKYCSGHPKIKKIWPVALGSSLAIFAFSLLPPPFEGMLAIVLVFFSFVPAIWIMCFGNDENNSLLLCFKPWRTLININETVEDSSYFPG